MIHVITSSHTIRQARNAPFSQQALKVLAEILGQAGIVAKVSESGHLVTTDKPLDKFPKFWSIDTV